MKKMRIYFFWILLLLWSCDQASAEQMKGVYGFSQKLFDAKTNQEIAKQLKDWGVNTVFCEVGDASLFNALHEQGIKAYIEFSCFAGEDYWKKYPDAHPVDQKGKKIEKVKWYAGVCPNHPELRQEKLDELRRLVSNHDLDGVWLDFIRYPCHWEVKEPQLGNSCFCKNCLSLFQKDSGVNISTAEEILLNYRNEWIAWRCQRITDFVGEVRKILDEEKQGLVLGLFAVPWKNEDYNNAIEWVIGQRYEDLARYVDVFSPMVYYRLCEKDISWVNELTYYLVAKTGKKVVPIVQLFGHSVKSNSDEFEQMLIYGLKEPSNGVIVFGLEDIIRKNFTHHLQQYFRQDGFK